MNVVNIVNDVFIICEKAIAVCTSFMLLDVMLYPIVTCAIFSILLTVVLNCSYVVCRVSEIVLTLVFACDCCCVEYLSRVPER